MTPGADQPIAGSDESTRAWLRRHEIRPRRAWGQSFLINPRIPERLVAGWDLEPAVRVLEIGAGAGALTMPLLERGVTVVAVERDARLCGLLRARGAREIEAGRLQVIERDILEVDPEEIVGEPGTPGAPGRRVLVGNLPYAITSPILLWTLRWIAAFEWAAYMVQREVADRLLAHPGTAAYGSLSLWLMYHVRVEREMAVGAANFWPMPKVESVVVRLRPREVPPVAVPSPHHLERVVRAAFGHRRKVIGGSLALGLPADRGAIDAALEAAGIDPRRRAETCTLEEFAALTRRLTEDRVLPSATESECRGEGGGPCDRTT